VVGPVNGVDDIADALPDLSRSVHQVITMSDPQRVVVWSDDPNPTNQVLIEGDHRWETLAPEQGPASSSNVVILIEYD